MRSGPPYSKSAVCATAPQARSAQAAAASAAVDFMVFLIGFSSIAYVLQEPVRRQFAPQPLAARRLVGHGGHGEKLHTLDIAALRIRDLFARAAAANLAADHVAETDVVAMPRDLGCAAALAVRFPAGILRAGNVSQPLVGRAELGPSDGCRRSPEPQRAVKPTERRVIRPSADRYDVHAGLQPLSPDNGNGGVGAGRKDIRAPVNLARLVAGFALDAVALSDLRCKTLSVPPGRTEHFEPLDFPHFQQSLHVRSRHAPDPSIPSARQSSRAMMSVPMALSAATRRCCR